MDLGRAKEFFTIWQPYFEVNDKLKRLMWSIPESILPIPKDVIEEVSNVIAKDYFDHENYEMSENMQRVGIACWSTHESDGAAISSTAKLLEMVESNTELKKTLLKSLAEASTIWDKDKIKVNKDMSASEAQEIIGCWNLQMEFNEKIYALDWYLPESILPYPKAVIAEASKKVARNNLFKRLLNKSAVDQADPMFYLGRYKPDSEALTIMYQTLKRVESSPELKKELLDKLSKANKKWSKSH